MAAKRNKLLFGLLVTLVVFLIAYKSAPYILLYNSVPGQKEFNDIEELRQSIDIKRIPAVCEELHQQVLSDFAATDFSQLGQRYRNQAMRTFRTVLACFARGEKIQECNELIKSMSVWGRSGSKWRLNPKGDYDFTTIWMVRLLYEFGHEDEILFPETRDYLVNTLLDSGGKPDLYVPLSLGMVYDTENHLLMREGSRYLKNQWKKAHGSEAARYDNHRNGMERWMVRYLNSIRVNGLYEYNSMPYTTYTVLPLLNLADYAQSPEVRMLAVSILDNIILRYAYGSLAWKQCTSFRRQTRYANSNRLDLNPIDLPLRLWAGLEYSHSQLQDERGPMLLAAVFSGYTPAQESMDINRMNSTLYSNTRKEGLQNYIPVQRIIYLVQVAPINVFQVSFLVQSRFFCRDRATV